MRDIEEFRRVSFTADPTHPVGPVELGDEELDAVHGGTVTSYDPFCTYIINTSGALDPPPPPPVA